MRNLNALGLSLALATGGCAVTVKHEIPAVDRDRSEISDADRRIMKETVNLRGSSGLEVHLNVPNKRPHGAFCSGDRYGFTVTANHPAWIRVYAVFGGKAILGWKSERPVTEFLSEAYAVQSPGIQTEELVVIAMPAVYGQDGFGGTAPSTECVGTKDMLATELLPRTAAIAKVPYKFSDPEKGCPDNPEVHSLQERARQYIGSLLKCF